ncbi:MAG: TIGR00266 family protein [Chloroflexi bacterium]|nr:TIGR00266 family protein [Chloroflexota bacterium]
MPQCSNCGTTVESGAQTCPSCNAPLGGGGDAPLRPTGNLAYRIEGTIMPVVTIDLQPGQTVYSESGGMSWMTGNIEMETSTGGGLGKMFKRAISGESLFIVNFASRGGAGSVTFASEFPGKIIPFQLDAGESLIVQKDAFMCAEKGVDLDIHFRKRLGAGLFGGEGFIMQRITGPGLAFVEMDGEVVEYTLGPGELLRVDTGHVGILEPTVSFDVEIVKGFKNILLGGEGLFLATLRGPGRVWLQTMPMMNLAKKVGEYMPQMGGKGPGGLTNINLGSLLGD